MHAEIVEIPPLKTGELSLVNCHSLMNLYSVLRAELVELGQRLEGNPGLLSAGIEECDRRLERLRHSRHALADAAHVDACHDVITSDIDGFLQARPMLAHEPAVVSSLGNLRSIFWLLQVRARDLLVRNGAPAGWARIDVADLQADFQEFFRAVEENSHGRFRFVYNLAQQQPHDYYIDLKLEGATGTKVALPFVFKEVMRDLIANARKYTNPGGQIRAALHSGPEGLRFVVEDTGRGIPAAELQTVVHAGQRGSNVVDIRTMGGGYGLTKAYLVTRHFGGRLWIDSDEGRGTRIRIWLPPPAAGFNGAPTIHE